MRFLPIFVLSIFVSSCAYADDYTITMTDSQAESYAEARGYRDLVPSFDTRTGDTDLVPNPETKKDFALKTLKDHVTSIIRSHDVDAGLEAERGQIESTVDSDLGSIGGNRR